MKSILLTSTALVAFSGAAYAEAHSGVSFAGEATLGYNDDTAGDNTGFYWDAAVDVTFAATLDNGVTAGATWSFDVVENDAFSTGTDIDADDFVVFVESEMASLYFGDTDPAAEPNYTGVDGSHLEFNDKSTHEIFFDAIIRGDVNVGGVFASLSYGVNEGVNEDALDALQVYASSEFGTFAVEAAYQGELDAVPGSEALIGLGASTTFAGADVGLGFLSQGDESSIGVDVSYPVGPVVIGGYYSVNEESSEDSWGLSADYADGPIAVSAFYDLTGETTADAEETEIGVEGSYDTGIGATVLAGFITTDVDDGSDSTSVYYVAGTYDLGGGAELLVSYGVDDDSTAGDEIGDPEYQEGVTVEVSFSF